MDVQSRPSVSIFRRTMKTAGAVLAFVCLVIGLHFVYTHTRNDDRPLITDQLIQQFRSNVDSFTHLEHRLPASFEETCRRLLPQEYLYVKNCSYWLQNDDTIPIDAWRHPLRFTVSGAMVEIRSAGADGTFDTPDDMFYNSADEAQRVHAMAGCYQIDLGWPEFPGNELVLKSGPVVWEGEYQGAPRVDRFSGPQWRPSPYPGGRDSLTVIWRTVDQGNVLLSFRWLGDSLIGRADGLIHKAYVVAYRSGCLPRV